MKKLSLRYIYIVIGLIIISFIYLFNNQFTRYFLESKNPYRTLFISNKESRNEDVNNYTSKVLGIVTADRATLENSPAPPQLSYDKLYALINGYRREHKLPTLAAHRALEQSAALKLLDMQHNQYWTHIDKEGRESWYLLEQVGYHFEKAGENLSFGYTTEWSIFTEWQKSPEHNAQMLKPEYEHMGLAADCHTYAQASKKTCIVVLHFGKQKL
jgi:uncharacterized protein YkwD